MGVPNSVYQLEEEAKKKQSQDEWVKNPTGDDFSTKWDGVEYTLKAHSSKKFSQIIAQHIKKHLATKIAQQKTGRRPFDALYQEAYESLSVRKDNE